MMWRGIHFDGREMSTGGRRWVSQYAEQWKATRYERGGLWFARVRFGLYRFAGKGKTAGAALTAALKEARAVRDLLNLGLPK